MLHYKALGFPIFRGKVPHRLGKKKLNKWGAGYMLSDEFQKEMGLRGIGDYITTCSGLNVRIAQLVPAYYHTRSGNGSILVDVNIYNNAGGYCSMRSCGVWAPHSRERVEADFVNFAKNWTLASEGKAFFAGMEDVYKKECLRAEKIIAAVESGGHIVDEIGEKFLPGFGQE